MGTRGEILIVEDHPGIARNIMRCFRGYHVSVAGTAAAASVALKSVVGLRAATVDLGLPDGSGLEVLQKLRRKLPHLPVIVITASLEAAELNRVQQLGAELACKPDFVPLLEAFVQRLSPVHDLAVSAKLSDREVRIVDLAMEGRCNKEIAVVLAVAPNTLKSQIRSILTKTGNVTLNDLVRKLGASDRRRG